MKQGLKSAVGLLAALGAALIVTLAVPAWEIATWVWP